jgi:hypothetical protein
LCDIIKSQNMSHEAITYGALLTSTRWRVKGETADEISARGQSYRLDLEAVRELRNTFLAVQPNDVQGLLAFLNGAGAWTTARLPVSLVEIWQHQAIIRCVLTGEKPNLLGKTRVWAEQRFAEMLLDALHIQSVMRQGNQPVPTKVEIGAYDVRGALYLSVWQDRVREMRFRYCAREDCPEHGPTRAPFEVTRPDRVYCSWYCGHLEAVRNKRASTRKRRR